MELTKKQIVIDNFHKHLDNCKQCEQNPFDLCSTGRDLFTKIQNTKFWSDRNVCE